MPSVSSPLAPKGQPMATKHTTAVLLVLLSVVLFASSCDARGLRVVHGRKGGRSSSRKSSHLPYKDVEATSLKKADDGWLARQTEARSTIHTAIDDRVMAQAEEGVAMASPTAAGTVVGATPAVVRVSRRLSRREDTGFHLDYAGPRTHTPSHN